MGIIANIKEMHKPRIIYPRIMVKDNVTTIITNAYNVWILKSVISPRIKNTGKE